MATVMTIGCKRQDPGFVTACRATGGNALARHAAGRFLKVPAMDDAIDLTRDGGVVKRVIKKARADASAPSDNLSLVDVHYEGTLADTGEVFDTTHEDNAVFSFELGKGSVIKAWDIAIRTMKVGEIAKITCKPDYAYGSAGSPPDIPPKPRKGASLGSVSDEKARLEELKKQREMTAALKEEEKKRREEAKAAAAARIQAKLEAKKHQGKGKGKAK
ncbi:Peptidylprolyl isomerase [Cocos nucifera]|uniref:peptidylprolyl isomerase n=1 Tax=Cocos nucifera TaxID=13894 RepID=A0A8K0I4K5_COCNU|nr:Peptidylprolyl isomerase [Cocos nucifera]